MARARGLQLAALGAAALALAGCGGGGASKRPSALDPGKTWIATVTTSLGAFRLRLDVADSPHTTASFAKLANDGFYDGLVFHRIVPGFVIQGGDPTGTGEGGPGYTTHDVPPPSTTYVRGIVAMAKAAADPPGTAGSQFFVVTGDASFLQPDYALLGRVTSGMAVVERIGRFGNGDAGVPTRRIVIERIRVASR
jgi:peptidyl-prolyl cis-trans isomerase B (cyclophilin B)